MPSEGNIASCSSLPVFTLGLTINVKCYHLVVLARKVLLVIVICVLVDFEIQQSKVICGLAN